MTWIRRALTADVVGGLSVVAVIAAAASPLWTGDGALALRDAWGYYLPTRAAVIDAWREGRLPFWTPFIACGYPLYAEGQAAPLYPLNVLLLVPGASFTRLFLLFIFAHFLIAGGGTYALLRRGVGSSPAASAAGALTFALSGFLVSHVQTVNILCATAWLPWIVLGVAQALEGRRRIGWGAFAAAAIALQVLAGHPQVTFLTLLTLLAWTAVWAARSGGGRRVRIGFGIAAITAAGLLLSAAQWLPTMDLASRCVRRQAGEAFLLQNSLPVPHLLTLLLPDLFGSPAHGTQWWVFPAEEFRVYLGVAPWVLVPLAFGRRNGSWAAWAGVLVIVGMVLMIGEANPLYRWLLRLPGFGFFRVPARYSLLLTLGSAVLLAVGLDRARTCGDTLPRRRIVSGLCLAILLGLAAAAAVAHLGGRTLVQALAEATQRHLEAGGMEVKSGAHYVQRWERILGFVQGELSPRSLPFLALAAAALAGWQLARGTGPGERRRRILLGGILGGHGLSLLAATWGWLPVVPADTMRADTPAARWLAERGAGSEWRYHFLEDFWTRREAVDPRTIDWPRERGFRTHWLRGMDDDLSLVRRLRSFGYKGSLVPERYAVWTSLVHWTPGGGPRETERVRRAYALAGVRYAVALDAPVAPHWQTRDEVDGWRMLEHPEAMPRVRWSRRYRAAPGPEAARRALEETLDREGPWPGEGEDIVEGAPASSGAVTPGPGAARLIRDGDTELEIAVDAATDGMLIVADAYDPGWEATVDGLPVPVHPANVAFRAIPVPAGRHDVALRYRPAAVAWGIRISLATALCLAAGGVYWVLRRGGPARGRSEGT